MYQGKVTQSRQYQAISYKHYLTLNKRSFTQAKGSSNVIQSKKSFWSQMTPCQHSAVGDDEGTHLI